MAVEGAHLQLEGLVKLRFKIPSELLQICHIVSRKVANNMRKVSQIRGDWKCGSGEQGWTQE